MNIIVILPILIALIVGSCLYGKKVWEKRVNVLGIAAVLLFAALLTAGLIGRRHMPTERTASMTYTLYPFTIADSLLQKPGMPQMVKPKYVMYDMGKENIITLVKPKSYVLKTPLPKYEGGFQYRRIYPPQTKMHVLFYYDGKTVQGSDTVVGFVVYDKEFTRMKLDYYHLKNVRFAWVGRNDNVKVPTIRKISEEYVDNSTWVVGFVVPNRTSYQVIYLPKDEYDRLPMNIRLNYYFDGYQRTAGRYVLPEKKPVTLASNGGK